MHILHLTQHSPNTAADGSPISYAASRVFYYGPINPENHDEGSHVFDAPGSYVVVKESIAVIDGLMAEPE